MVSDVFVVPVRKFHPVTCLDARSGWSGRASESITLMVTLETLLKARGFSIRQIAHELGVGMGAERRVLQTGTGAKEVCQNPVPEAV